MGEAGRTDDRRVSDDVLALIVEPPLPVANTLLEEARRLAGRLGEIAGALKWMRPHRYAAPLAIRLSVEAGLGSEALDPLGDAVMEPVGRAAEILTRGREEFAVQLGPVGVEPCGDRAVIRSRLVSARPEDLASFLGGVEDHLGVLDMHATSAEAVRVCLGVVPAEHLDAVRAAIEPKETPVAGWLLGGVCLALATVDSDLGLLEAKRLRFLPLKRLGSRR